jgi:hypothetical protein
MFLPIPSALMPDGTAPFYMNDAMEIDFHLGSQGYYDGVLRGTFTVVAASDMFSGGMRYTQAGIMRLYDATAGLPVGSVTLGGFAVSVTGQLCVTTDAITAASKFIEGVAVQQDGTVHFVDASPAALFRYRKGITVTGAGVSTWADKSGNARDLLQGTDASRPALQADGSILFDGVNDFLKTAGFTFNQPETVYLLAKQVTFTAGEYVFDGNAGNDLSFNQTGASPTVTQYAGGGGDVNANTNWLIDTYAAIAIIFNGASSLIRVNNVTVSGGNPGAANAGGFTLGSNSSGTGGWSNIQAKESILYPGAHTTARQTWEIARRLPLIA